MVAHFKLSRMQAVGAIFWQPGNCRTPEFLEYSPQFGIEVATKISNRVWVKHWPKSGWQIDEGFPELLMFGPLFRHFPEFLKK